LEIILSVLEIIVEFEVKVYTKKCFDPALTETKQSSNILSLKQSGHHMHSVGKKRKRCLKCQKIITEIPQNFFAALSLAVMTTVSHCSASYL